MDLSATWKKSAMKTLVWPRKSCLKPRTETRWRWNQIREIENYAFLAQKALISGLNTSMLAWFSEKRKKWTLPTKKEICSRGSRKASEGSENDFVSVRHFFPQMLLQQRCRVAWWSRRCANFLTFNVENPISVPVNFCYKFWNCTYDPMEQGKTFGLGKTLWQDVRIWNWW